MSMDGRCLVAIGVSAGGVEALKTILPGLPADFPHATVVVQHVPPDRGDTLPRLFRDYCALRVKEAEDKEWIEPGTIYFAPSNYHLLVERDGSLSLSSDEPENFSRPSIDVCFESVASAFGERAVGVILTGANHDGARGLKRISEAGGRAFVQDPESAYASAMPAAAAGAVKNAKVMSLKDIRTELLGLVHETRGAKA